MKQLQRRTRLLYLGFAFPPGMQAMFPGTNPAGHGFETQMVAALRAHFEIRSAGVLPAQVPPLPLAVDPASGVAHDVILLDRPPALWHRLRSLAKLQHQYRLWRAAGWVPDAVLSYNLSPIYNSFLRRLKRQPACPKLVVLLLDSSHLGRALPPLKRFRYRLKPLVIPDAGMIREFDGCIGLSRSTEQFFLPRGIPFLWMPGGCTPSRAFREPPGAATRATQAPISFGYFGALATHSGVMPLAETFLAGQSPNTLHVCGHGKLADDIARLARSHARLKFHGLLPSQEDCLRLAASWDVLVNPRPSSHGNENNFPSKVFEYALCGRAILTTRLAGVDAVLGPEALYLDAERLKDDLRAQLPVVAAMPRVELRRRGNALCERVTAHYSWPRQAASMAEFITRLL